MKYLYLVWSFLVCLWFASSTASGFVFFPITLGGETSKTPGVHHK